MSEAYKQIAEGYKMLAAGYEALAGADAPKAEPKKKAAKKEEPVAEPKAEVASEEVKKVTIEDIRALMRTKNKEGKMDKCQAVLQEFGAIKLSDVPEEKYEELLARVEVL